LNEQGQVEEIKSLILVFIFFGVVIPLLVRATGDPYNIAPIIAIIAALLLVVIGISKRG